MQILNLTRARVSAEPAMREGRVVDNIFAPEQNQRDDPDLSRHIEEEPEKRRLDLRRDGGIR